MATDKHALSEILAPNVAVLAPMDLVITDSIKRLMLAYPDDVELQVNAGNCVLTMPTESSNDIIAYLYGMTEMVSTRQDEAGGITTLRIEQFNWRGDR